MGKLKIKRDDNVLVIAGEHKGSEGKVIRVIYDQNKAIIEGVNIVKKHSKPSAKNPQGGIVEKEAPIHISNLSLTTADGQASRVGYRVEDGIKIRFAKKNNQEVK